MTIFSFQKHNLVEGLFRRRFNVYHADNPGNLVEGQLEGTDAAVTQINGFDMGPTHSRDSFVFRGYFRPDTTATNWRFRTNSDDGSFVWLGDDAIPNTVDLNTSNVVVDNGGEHGAATVTSGNQSLTAGVLYPIAIIAGNNTGPGSLTFSVSRNGGTNYFTDLSDLVFYDPSADNGFNID